MVIDTDRFFYGIFDDNNLLLENGEVIGDVSKELLSHPTINKTFKKKNVCVMDEVIHLPYDSKGEELSPYIIKHLPNAVLNQEKYIGQKISSFYYLPINLNSVLKQIFEDNIHHLSTLLGDYQYPSSQEKVMVFISQNRCHISITNNIGLSFYNQYNCAGPEDYLYYVLALFQLHELDQAETIVELSGRIDKESPISKLLSEYFGKITLADPYQLKVSDGLIKHYYLDLHLTALCV